MVDAGPSRITVGAGRFAAGGGGSALRAGRSVADGAWITAGGGRITAGSGRSLAGGGRPAAGGGPDSVEAIVAAAIPGAAMGRWPCLYATSARLEVVEVTARAGPVVHLVAKHLGRRAMSEAARQAKPAAWHCAGRELDVYRHILDGAALGTPALIGGCADDHAGVLVVEFVEGSPLVEIGDFGSWEAAARWLARMHSIFTGARLTNPASRAPMKLVRYNRRLLGAAGRRGLARAEELARGSSGVRAALAEAHNQALGTLALSPPTLVHGDFYPSNILVAQDRVAVVDWELAGTGPGALDLAALIAGCWTLGQRHDLIRAYHREMAAAGPAASFRDLMRVVDLASLHLALKWLGSTAAWEAPEEHRRDWFADAVVALSRIEGGPG